MKDTLPADDLKSTIRRVGRYRPRAGHEALQDARRRQKTEE
ncbi:hypothetical protein [Azospirillum melinis]|nr:hypothetical protein [Azospirillum melinis]MBP2306295.1 hypothetical protein [Azospirillum melinis]